MYVCLCFSDRTLMFLIRCRKFHCSYLCIVLIYNDASVFTYNLSFMGLLFNTRKYVYNNNNNKDINKCKQKN